jgi:histidinol phosphatase-like enzyme (inositol monophosphatase family)
MTPPVRDLLDVAIEAAWSAGRHTLAFFGNDVEIETKADSTPVTRADRESELVARKVIGRAFPDHAILGEEHGETTGTVPVRWIIDPIDGTKTFVRGVPFYGTLVGVEVDGDPVAGAVYLPALDEMVAGAPGLGATRNGRPCRVSAETDLANALLVTWSMRAWSDHPGFDSLVASTKMQRTWGDCYGYVLVATGRAEVCADPLMKPWDCAAVLPIVEAAGGRFTDLAGRRTIGGGNALATNGALHERALALLSG